MYKYLVFLVVLIACCSPTDITVTPGNGLIPYESVIGKEYYSNGNLAAVISADMTTYFTHTIEKWHFYPESIIVIATHYDHATLQALDQFKYAAIITGETDKIWIDSDGDTWCTTETIWKTYARSNWNTCGWTDVYSFTSPPENIIIDYSPEPNTCISLGSYELLKRYAILDTFPPVAIWYPEGWIGTVCHTVP